MHDQALVRGVEEHGSWAVIESRLTFTFFQGSKIAISRIMLIIVIGASVRLVAIEFADIGLV